MTALQAELAMIPPLTLAWKERALQGVLRMIPAKLAVFCHFADFRDGEVPRVLDAGAQGSLDPEGDAALGEWMQQRDMAESHPFLKSLMSIEKKCFTHRRIELVDDVEWERSEILTNYFRACEVDDNMTSLYRFNRSNHAYGFGMHRHPTDRPFERRDRVLLHLLQRSLGPMFEQYRAEQMRTRDELTPRLRETLEYLLAGDSEKQIARRLHLSPHTVHDYVKALYRHYDVSSRSELLIACLDPARRERSFESRSGHTNGA